MFSNYNYINGTHKKPTKNFTRQHINTIKKETKKNKCPIQMETWGGGGRKVYIVR